MSFTTAAYNTLRLSQLDPDIFPIPKFAMESKTLDCALLVVTHSFLVLINIVSRPRSAAVITSSTSKRRYQYASFPGPCSCPHSMGFISSCVGQWGPFEPGTGPPLSLVLAGPCCSARTSGFQHSVFTGRRRTGHFTRDRERLSKPVP